MFPLLLQIIRRLMQGEVVNTFKNPNIIGRDRNTVQFFDGGKFVYGYGRTYRGALWDAARRSVNDKVNL